MLRSLLLYVWISCLALAEAQAKGPTPDAVLAELKAGNQRHVGTQYKPNNHKPVARRVELATGQRPGAIVLSCADSRVPPEIVFDQGLGDLFAVRVAGNIVEDFGVGSIEYAAEHLGSKLIVVLGHERCGAVEQSKDMPGDKLDNAVMTNVRLAVEQLKKSQPILAGMIGHGKIKIAGARYDLDTGVVTWLE